MVRALLVLALLALTGCNLVTDYDHSTAESGLSARAGGGALVLRNGTAETVHYVALEAETANRVDLYHDPRGWPGIPPGQRVRIDYGDLMGYDRDSEQAVVHWWTERSGSGVLRLRL